jgi:hypothetical protein
MRLAVLILLLMASVASAAQSGVTQFLATMSAAVEAYYSKARAVVARETVTLQPLAPDLRPAGAARQLEYDVRIEWTPPTATITREPLRRRGIIAGSTAEAECFDPEPAAFEPLAMLQTERQPSFHFRLVGTERLSGRAITILEYRPRSEKPASVSWTGRCGAITLNGGTVGRVWADSVTGDVFRVDDRLARPVSYLLPIEHVRSALAAPVSQRLDRLNVSTRYEAISFRDPDERIMLPVSITTMTVIHNGGVPRLLTTHRFSHYRRFVTGTRVVK